MTTTTEEVHGPIDFALIEFPPGVPDGASAEALLDLVESGTIRLLDLLIAHRAEDGTVSVLDIDGAGDTAFVQFSGARSGLIGDDDVAEAGNVHDPGLDRGAHRVRELVGDPVRPGRPVPRRRARREHAHPGEGRHGRPRRTSSRQKASRTMPGLIRGVARTAVIAGTASAVNGRVQRRQAEKYADRDAAIAAERQQSYNAQMAPPPQAAPPAYAAPAPAAAPPGPATADVIAQLKSLAELRDQGILTDEEFAAQKAKLLG